MLHKSKLKLILRQTPTVEMIWMAIMTGLPANRSLALIQNQEIAPIQLIADVLTKEKMNVNLCAADGWLGRGADVAKSMVRLSD